jgi:maleate cis-trans isomerase
MSKLTKPERQYLKGIVCSLSIEKNTDQQIQEFLKEKGIEVTRSHITHIRNDIEKSAEKWYNELRSSKYL